VGASVIAETLVGDPTGRPREVRWISATEVGVWGRQETQLETVFAPLNLHRFICRDFLGRSRSGA
jgi:hypothetical protein